jgi:hypothetical protein
VWYLKLYLFFCILYFSVYLAVLWPSAERIWGSLSDTICKSRWFRSYHQNRAWKGQAMTQCWLIHVSTWLSHGAPRHLVKHCSVFSESVWGMRWTMNQYVKQIVFLYMSGLWPSPGDLSRTKKLRKRELLSDSVSWTLVFPGFELQLGVRHFLGLSLPALWRLGLNHQQSWVSILPNVDVEISQPPQLYDTILYNRIHITIWVPFQRNNSATMSGPTRMNVD